MLLDRLAEYHHRRREQLPFAYKETPVPWVVHLTSEGKLVPPFQRTSGTQRGSRNPGNSIPVPALMVPRASGPRATLLVDRADYALGFAGHDPEQKTSDATQRNHQLFLDLLSRCHQSTEEPSVQAVLNFLRGPENIQDNYPSDLESSDTIGFMVDGLAPQNLASVQGFWADHQAQATTGQSNASCLVCGQARPIARRHPKVKGIPGGQTSGTSLVSANLPAFESYGLEASLISPVCLQCAEAYTNGINTLLSDESSRMREGSVVYIFWDQDGSVSPFPGLMSSPTTQQVETLLRSYWRGRQSVLSPQDLTLFYSAAVSASGGRVVVRDWLETTLANAHHNLARYFLLQRLPGHEPFSLFRLRQSLAPPRSSRGGDRGDSLPANITRWLVRCALLGGPLPDGLLYQAVRRNRAEQGVAPARAALIKMVLLSNLPDEAINEEEYMDTQTQQDSAYLCGRLLALLEQAQSLALGNPNTTLVDRFYGSASSTPASVFGLLLKNGQAHLSKLRHEREGAYHYLQRELGQVMEQIPSFPSTLDLRKQGLFALGYYYQRQERFRRRDAPDPQEEPGEETDSQ